MWRCLNIGLGLVAVLFAVSGMVAAESDSLINNTFGLGNLKSIDSELKVASGQKAPDFTLPSVSGKKMWVKNNMPGVQLYIENDKYKYAEPDAILIDDMEKNVEAWKEAGGIGILHKSAPQTEREIIELALTPGIL